MERARERLEERGNGWDEAQKGKCPHKEENVPRQKQLLTHQLAVEMRC